MISAIGSDVATWHPPPPSYEMPRGPDQHLRSDVLDIGPRHSSVHVSRVRAQDRCPQRGLQRPRFQGTLTRTDRDAGSGFVATTSTTWPGQRSTIGRVDEFVPRDFDVP